MWCLTLVLVPSPHVTEQASQLSHEAHAPSTEMKRHTFPFQNITCINYINAPGQDVSPAITPTDVTAPALDLLHQHVLWLSAYLGVA